MSKKAKPEETRQPLEVPGNPPVNLPLTSQGTANEVVRIASLAAHPLVFSKLGALQGFVLAPGTQLVLSPETILEFSDQIEKSAAAGRIRMC